MTRLLALVILLLPAVAAAQQPAPSSQRPSESTQQPAPSSSSNPQRRRPSMVGYINDSTIGSEVRIRYDSAFDMSTPDRAEFFYAKCGCYRFLPANDPAFDPSAKGPGPGVLTNLNYQQLYVHAEFAPVSRFSVTAELPFRFLKPDTFAPGTGSFGNQSGVSDLQVGAKLGLVSGPRRRLTAAVQVWAPTGDALKGLGTDHWSIEPMLLYLEQPTDRFTIEAQLGDVIPTSGSAGIPATSSNKFWGSVIYWGIGPSFQVYRGPRVAFAPVVELVGWHVVEGFQTGDVADASGTNIVNLKLGGRLLLGSRSAIYVGYGHALTKADWYDNMVRLEYRASF